MRPPLRWRHFVWKPRSHSTGAGQRYAHSWAHTQRYYLRSVYFILENQDTAYHCLSFYGVFLFLSSFLSLLFQVVKADTVKSCAPHLSNLVWGPLPLDLDAMARFATPPPPTLDPKENQVSKSKQARPPLTSSSSSSMAHSPRYAHSSHPERAGRSSLLINRAQPLRRRRTRRHLQGEHQRRAFAPGVKGVGIGSVPAQRRSLVPVASAPSSVRGQHSPRDALGSDGSGSTPSKGTVRPKASLSSSLSRVAGGGTQPPAVLLRTLPGAVYTMVMLREPFDRLV